VASASLVAMIHAPATAAGESERAPGRYTVTPIEGGFLRTDTDTGVVSHCARKDMTWMCTTVADDYQVVQRRLDDLARENASLRKQIAELKSSEGSLPTSPAPGRKLELPSEEEIDKALGYFDRLLRKFKDFVDKQRGAEAPGRQL
jgi:hypothetical protein